MKKIILALIFCTLGVAGIDNQTPEVNNKNIRLKSISSNIKEKINKFIRFCVGFLVIFLAFIIARKVTNTKKTPQ